LDQAEGFDPEIRFGEDWDLWLRLRLDWDFVFVPVPLAYIRRHTQTQCQLPRPENTERVLNDHLRLLNKAFAAWPGSPGVLPGLRNRSLARQYGQAAFANYAWSRWDRGRRYLERAITLDPATWQENARLTKMLLSHGIAVAEIEGAFQVERMRRYLEGTLEHLPVGLDLPPQTYRRVLAKLLAEASFRSHLSGDRRATRYFTWHAFRADRSSLLRDRGMVRRLLSSVV
jgi:hypothetical protein